jgi:hypothetical protein
MGRPQAHARKHKKSMRLISAAAMDHIRAQLPAIPADLFTVTFRDGTTFRRTSTDIAITYGADTWEARSPNMQRTSLSVVNTIEVPELQVTLSATDDDFVGGTNIKTAIHQGALDGARLKLERLIMPVPAPGVLMPAGGDTSLGPPVVLFDGRVGDVEITAMGAAISAKGDVVIMNQMIPHNLYQASCQWTFCSQGCTLDAATLTNAFVVGTGANISFIPWTAAPSIPENYVLGKIRFLTGDNTGQVRSIRDATVAGVYVTYPFFQTPVAGDDFECLPGCNKTRSGAVAGFGCEEYTNTQHHRGFRNIPQVVYAI